MSEQNRNNELNEDTGSSIFRGFEQAQAEDSVFGTGIADRSVGMLGQPKNRKPLYFLIFASIVLLVAIMVVVYVRIIAAGGAIATETPSATETTTSASVDESTADTLSKEPTQTADPRDAVKDLQDSANCQDSTAAAATIGAFAKESDGNDDDVALVSRTLSELSSSCGADFTVQLKTALTIQASKFPGSIYSEVTGSDWFSLARKAPAGATDLTEFTTPMNNIRCQIGDDSVACSIYAYSYVSPAGCEGKAATYTVGLADDTVADCATEINAGTVVPYGSTIAHNGFVCSTDQATGVQCWSELSGHGFSLRREAGETY